VQVSKGGYALMIIAIRNPARSDQPESSDRTDTFQCRAGKECRTTQRSGGKHANQTPPGMRVALLCVGIMLIIMVYLELCQLQCARLNTSRNITHHTPEELWATKFSPGTSNGFSGRRLDALIWILLGIHNEYVIMACWPPICLLAEGIAEHHL
jgi:hypothetical protein